MVVVIRDLILQMHAVSLKSREGIAIVTFIVTDTTTAVQICVRSTASVSCNTYTIPARTCSQAGISGCTHSHKKTTKKQKKTAPVVQEASLQQSLYKLHNVSQ